MNKTKLDIDEINVLVVFETVGEQNPMDLKFSSKVLKSEIEINRISKFSEFARKYAN